MVERAFSPNTAEAGGLAGYFTQVFAVADAEVRKLRHDPSELFTRALQPAIWLLLFGEVMAQVRGLGTGQGRYSEIPRSFGNRLTESAVSIPLAW